MSKAKIPKPSGWVKGTHLRRLKLMGHLVNAKNVTIYSKFQEGSCAVFTEEEVEDYAKDVRHEALEDAVDACRVFAKSLESAGCEQEASCVGGFVFAIRERKGGAA